MDGEPTDNCSEIMRFLGDRRGLFSGFFVGEESNDNGSEILHFLGDRLG